MRLRLDELSARHRVVHGGKGWVVMAAPHPDGPHLRVRLIAPWRGGERTSFHAPPGRDILMDTPSRWDGPLPEADPQRWESWPVVHSLPPCPDCDQPQRMVLGSTIIKHRAGCARGQR